MATRRKRCPICGELIDDDQKAIPYGQRFIHEGCFKNMSTLVTGKKQSDGKVREAEHKHREQARKKEKQEAQRHPQITIEVTEEEYKEKKETLAYLEQRTGQPSNAKVYQVLKNYCTKYGFTYQGILDTLQYYCEVLEKPLTGDGVGIIPYYYGEARVYMERFKANQHINDSITPQQLRDMYKETVITIKRKKPEGLIDISSLT